MGNWWAGAARRAGRREGHAAGATCVYGWVVVAVLSSVGCRCEVEGAGEREGKSSPRRERRELTGAWRALSPWDRRPCAFAFRGPPQPPFPAVTLAGFHPSFRASRLFSQSLV
jgi:hypothetical protein